MNADERRHIRAYAFFTGILPLWLRPAIRRQYGLTVVRIPSPLRCNAL